MTARYCFYDLETFGTTPGRDRIAQFAVQRTDAHFQPVAEPEVEYCQPPLWPLPEPGACVVTGITPQQAQARGLPEWRFCEALLAALAGPNTCVVGYNSSQFDDPFVQHLCWRNFQDPYAWHWRDGNSRWDLLTLVRAAFALRPEGLQWPTKSDGEPSLKLEDLARVNQLPQPKAHDALGDVTATLALAQLLQRAQPKLTRYALGLRDKRQVLDMLEPGQPLAHVSGKIPGRHRCLTLWLPVVANATNANQWHGLDLRGPITPWLEWPAEDLAEAIYSRNEDLPEGLERPLLKGVTLNRAPFLAAPATIDAESAQRAHLDLDECAAKAATLRQHWDLIVAKVRAIEGIRPDYADRDVEARLYDGFVPESDRRLSEEILVTPLEDLVGFSGRFQDARLEELLFRFRARHAADTLSAAEQEEWRRLSRQQIEFAPHGGLSLEDFMAQVQVMGQQAQGNDKQVLGELWRWGQDAARSVGLL